ncbi:MAG TPA: VgrG-related protein [Candidatus Sulfomarinibacteraceae bacterium]|nr:VgrG-related protein [Candidatus Sulfomarinibacteraceae bacterium]
MINDRPLTNDIFIKIDGSPLSNEKMGLLTRVVVDQNTHLPGMFSLHFLDPELELLDDASINLTKTVEISVADDKETKHTLIKGEITALEPIFDQDASCQVVISGYDKSHRLYRETKSCSYLNQKDSDLANQIAGNAGLSAEVDSTSTVYEHIYQDNQSDLAFLMQRAWRIGYECFVADGKLYFRKPRTDSSGATLKRQIDLLFFRPRMTLAEQVDEVIVRGWDPQKQEAIVGQASSGKLYPSTGESKNGASWAKSFGAGKVVVVDHPVTNQAEANNIAQARLDELSGAFVEAEGIALNRPDVVAGKTVKLEDLGVRFSGTYMVTSATHVYTERYLKTTFTVRGTRTGTLAEQAQRQEPGRRWPGVVTALVTNNDDPEKEGRVKVKFPWMTDEHESAWARVASAGAGPEAGFDNTPDVNDEVIVAFEQGDINFPVVLGGLWSNKKKPPPEGTDTAQGERSLVRTWRSRNGHAIVLYDNADKKVEIVTIDGHKITLDDANKKVEIASSAGHTVTLDDQGKKVEIKSSAGNSVTMNDTGSKVSVQSKGNVEVKATGNLSLEAGGILDVKANGPVNIKGAMVNLN